MLWKRHFAHKSKPRAEMPNCQKISLHLLLFVWKMLGFWKLRLGFEELQLNLLFLNASLTESSKVLDPGRFLLNARKRLQESVSISLKTCSWAASNVWMFGWSIRSNVSCRALALMLTFSKTWNLSRLMFDKRCMSSICRRKFQKFAMILFKSTFCVNFSFLTCFKR